MTMCGISYPCTREVAQAIAEGVVRRSMDKMMFGCWTAEVNGESLGPFRYSPDVPSGGRTGMVLYVGRMVRMGDVEYVSAIDTTVWGYDPNSVHLANIIGRIGDTAVVYNTEQPQWPDLVCVVAIENPGNQLGWQFIGWEILFR